MKECPLEMALLYMSSASFVLLIAQTISNKQIPTRYREKQVEKKHCDDDMTIVGEKVKKRKKMVLFWRKRREREKKCSFSF